MEKPEKLNIAVVGYGRMGRLVREILLQKGVISRIIDNDGVFHEGMYCDWSGDSLKNIDSTICFTSPDAGYETTKRILSAGVDAVVGTTKFYLNADGLENKAMLEEFDALAKQNNCRMLYASNFSIGMNIFWKALEHIAPALAAASYDVGVQELHHKNKVDYAGTLKTIGKILMESYKDRTKLNFGDLERKRADNEITMAATRVGYVPGTHQVIFDCPTDTLEILHRVRDPRVFAAGAVDGAYWLRKQGPGLYNIRDMIK